MKLCGGRSSGLPCNGSLNDLRLLQGGGSSPRTPLPGLPVRLRLPQRPRRRCSGGSQRTGEPLAAAEREAKQNSAGGEAALFRQDILKSRAVRARSLDEVYRLVKGDDQLTGTFHDLKGAGLLRPRDNEIEKARQSAEPLVFPNYHEKIVFAVLALDDTGCFIWELLHGIPGEQDRESCDSVRGKLRFVLPQEKSGTRDNPMSRRDFGGVDQPG